MANDDAAAIGAFAHHYRSGKQSDLRLIAKDRTTWNVHRLVVCAQSPVLDTKASTGVMVIELDDDVTIIDQAIEWMYGIDRDRLLIDGKSLEDVTKMGPGVMYGEILAMTDLAHFGEKVSLPERKKNVPSTKLTPLPVPHPQAQGACHRACRTTHQERHFTPVYHQRCTPTRSQGCCGHYAPCFDLTRPRTGPNSARYSFRR